MGQTRNTYKTLVRKLEGDKSLRRPNGKREDNIKINLKTG
jgi:hypothetical protein